MKPDDEPETQAIVYELWSDEDLRWIEIPCPTIELAAFLEAWCEKNRSIFRRRPFGRGNAVPAKEVDPHHGASSHDEELWSRAISLWLTARDDYT